VSVPAVRAGHLSLCVALCVAVPLLTGCGVPDRDPDPDTNPSPGSSIAFSEQGTLELLPSEVHTIEVMTEPGAEVTLLLLGDTFDASLAAGVIKADAQGLAQVELKAPKQPAAFILRAQVAVDTSAELHVAVSELGFTTIRVLPTYLGNRELSAWSADILVGKTCDVALASYPENPVGALHADAALGEVPTIASVPVGPALAVAIRSGALVAGCVSFTATKPDKTEEVSVTAVDRPVVLEGVELDVSLEFAPGEGYGPLLESSIVDLADAAFPPETPFTYLLLDAMQAELEIASSQSFEALREQGELDESVAVALGGYHAHAACLALKSSAVSYALADAESTTSRIEGVIGSDEGYASPSFQLDSFSGLSAAVIGAPASVPFSWSATADDVLVMSGTLPVSTTRLAGAFMSAALTAELGQPITMPQAIASAADCPQIGTIVAQSGVVGCDAACLEAACEAAVLKRWDVGLSIGDSSDGSQGYLEISIGGQAEVSAALSPTSFSGSWLGKISRVGQASGAEEQTAVEGEASGEVPPPP